jgi:hypothetical protein
MSSVVFCSSWARQYAGSSSKRVPSGQSVSAWSRASARRVSSAVVLRIGLR